jgi:serine protease Do
MTARIVIRHLSGSKINQNEQFPLDGFTELTIGRDPGSTLTFDAQRDDAVSRRHAIITIHQGEHPTFRIADQGSRNGTLVNGERIAAEMELLPDDQVELGKGGPKFSFDVQPRPPNMMGRTRQINTGATTGATRILDTSDIEAAAMAASQTSADARPSVGRATVERMLVAQSKQTNKNWMYVLAGVLTFVVVGAGALYHYNKVKTEQAEADAKAAATEALATQKAEQDKALAEQHAEAHRKLANSEAAVRHDIGESPAEVVRKYGNATVVIDAQWQLYDRASGKPLYQMIKTFATDKGKMPLPCFVELTNGVIIRWLTTDDQNQTNQRVGQSLRGSGFVIDPSGFIMTNKHVAAGWLIQYGLHAPVQKAAIFKLGSMAKPELIDLANDPRFSSKEEFLDKWTPGDQSGNAGGAVFRSDAPIPVDTNLHYFEGRADILEVRFPGSVASVSAHLVRASPLADVAEIKIDAQQPLAAVQLAQTDDVKVGEKVTVLGYPAFSAQTIALIQSAEAGSVQNKREEVPEPTVTEGLVSQMSAGVKQSQGVTTYGRMGDTYQLTVPTGAGNSGGPVFDANGKVIGLFTYGDPQRETTTFAVPIKYGRDLSQMQNAAN